MAASFDGEVARRLPLAEAALRLFDFALADDFLTAVFQRHRGRSYEGVISFPTFVRLVSDALLSHHGSAHQRFRSAREDDTLDASVQALYAKLRRVPLGLSTGLFAAAAARLRPVRRPSSPTRCPRRWRPSGPWASTARSSSMSPRSSSRCAG